MVKNNYLLLHYTQKRMSILRTIPNRKEYPEGPYTIRGVPFPFTNEGGVKERLGHPKEYRQGNSPYDFNGIPIYDLLPEEVRKLASSGLAISNLVRYVKGEIPFLTLWTFECFIMRRLTNDVTDEEVWENIRGQVQEQLDRGVAEANITLN